MTPHHVTRQPMSLSSMDPYYEHDEKHHNPPPYAPHDCECADPNAPSHRACHESRSRRLLIPALISTVTVIAIILISCIHDLVTLGVFSADDGVLGLGKRALGARDSSGTDSGSSFVDNKCAFSNFDVNSYGTGLMQTNCLVYLIIVFVGLFLVLVFGIMLSAWCCRGISRSLLSTTWN